MKILVNIDQKAALLAGIDAPSSTAEIEINPAELSQEHREFLARFLSGGYRADCSVAGHYLRLVNATQDDLISALVDVRSKIDAQIAERKNARIKKIQDAISITREYIQSVQYCSEGHCVYASVSLMRIDSCYCSNDEDDEDEEEKKLYTEYLEARERVDAENEKRKAAFQPILIKKHAEKMVAINKAKAEYNELYARLPENLRKRNDAGLAHWPEIETEIKKLICNDVGFEYVEFDRYINSTNHVTDDEFIQFENLNVPAGWVKELKKVRNDDDINRNVIELSTNYAGLDVETYVEFAQE